MRALYLRSNQVAVYFTAHETGPNISSLKGSLQGNLTDTQKGRYDRHALEISKLLHGSKRVVSLGGGTGSLEKRLVKLCPHIQFMVSDIYDKEPVSESEIAFTTLDMTDTESLRAKLEGFDTVLIINALSPFFPKEVENVFGEIGASQVSNVIIYSAEDLRFVGYFAAFIKRQMIKKRSVWIGYLFSSRFISRLAKKNGLSRTAFARPRQHGALTPIWGNTYLAAFSRGKRAAIDKPLVAENLIM